MSRETRGMAAMRPFIPARKYEAYMDPQRDVLGTTAVRSTRISFAPPTFQLQQQQLAAQEHSRPRRHLSPASSSKRAYSTPPPQSLFHPPMVGPIRTADSREGSRGPAANQPPRPPNAWILYRSDKLRELPPCPPGAPRRAQADISKQISQMWKTESEKVRADYEYRANQKKTEHQEKYPNYRFQPMKKADKERLREEKKQRIDREREALRNRGKATRPGFVPPMAPTALSYPPSMEARYGPAGPSPPLSAAPSRDSSPGPPLDTKALDASLQGIASHQSSDAFARPSPQGTTMPEAGPSTLSSSRSSKSPLEATPPDGQSPSPLSIISPRPMLAIEQQLSQSFSGTTEWNQPSSPHASSSVSDMAALHWWENMSASQSLGADNANDFIQLNIPLPDPNRSWETDDPFMFNTVQALIEGTQVPNVFEISTLDSTGQANSSNLLQDPAPGEIEVSMTNAFAQYINTDAMKPDIEEGQDAQNPFETFAPGFYAGLNFPTLDFMSESDGKYPGMASSSYPVLSNPMGPISPSELSPGSAIDNANLLSSSVENLLALQQQASSNSFVDVLNLDSMVPANNGMYPPMQTQQTPPKPMGGIMASIASSYAQSQAAANSNDHMHRQDFQRPAPPAHSHSMPAPYVPPAGAIHSTKRRAAANWTKMSVPVNLSKAAEPREDNGINPMDLRRYDMQRQRAGAS